MVGTEEGEIAEATRGLGLALAEMEASRVSTTGDSKRGSCQKSGEDATPLSTGLTTKRR